MGLDYPMHCVGNIGVHDTEAEDYIHHNGKEMLRFLCGCELAVDGTSTLPMFQTMYGFFDEKHCIGNRCQGGMAGPVEYANHFSSCSKKGS